MSIVQIMVLGEKNNRQSRLSPTWPKHQVFKSEVKKGELMAVPFFRCVTGQGGQDSVVSSVPVP